MNNDQNNIASLAQRFWRSHTARFLMVGFITLILLIPLAQLGFLIQERKYRQEEVAQELKKEYGGKLDYYGVVLQVPVLKKIEQTIREGDTEKTVVENKYKVLYLFPETSNDQIVSNVSEKSRGIFSIPVFKATISGKAHFDLSKAAALNSGTIDWQNAKIMVLTNAEARYKEIGKMMINGRNYTPEPLQTLADERYTILGTEALKLDPAQTKSLAVSVESTFNGCEEITLQPLTASNTTRISSNWADPGFSGSSLPDPETLDISEKGFASHFSSSNLQHRNGGLNTLSNLDNYSFSEVRFFKPVDHYQLNERTIKYAALVLILTFAVLMLIQLVGKVSFHPLHYFMVGLALVMFYSLLLSFSEHIGFIPAYLIASAAIVSVITWYARAVLRSLKFALMSAASLSLLYLFLLVLVNLETYALIVGSIGLLLVLVAIMSVTRKLNFQEE